MSREEKKNNKQLRKKNYNSHQIIIIPTLQNKYIYCLTCMDVTCFQSNRCQSIKQKKKGKFINQERTYKSNKQTKKGNQQNKHVRHHT